MENIIAIIVGVVLLFIAAKAINTLSKLKKDGILSDGVIYDFQQNPRSSINNKYPIVRFLTTNNHWITEPSSYGIFSGFYKKGQKVKVLYDKENPNFFVIYATINNAINYSLLIIGCLLVAGGVILLIGI